MSSAGQHAPHTIQHDPKSAFHTTGTRDVVPELNFSCNHNPVSGLEPLATSCWPTPAAGSHQPWAGIIKTTAVTLTTAIPPHLTPCRTLLNLLLPVQLAAEIQESAACITQLERHVAHHCDVEVVLQHSCHLLKAQVRGIWII